MKSALIYFFTILLSFAMLQACGPEETETERDQQAVQDSLAQVYEAEMEQMRQDSLARVREDSIAAAEGSEQREERIEYSESGNFVVQVEAWRSEEKAQQQANEWRNRGYDRAFVVSYGHEETGDVWYRVRIGQFNSREMAVRLQNNLNEEYNAVSWVSIIGQPVEQDAMQGN